MTAEPREWLIALPYRTPPLSLNQRGHWAAKARATRDVRSRAAWLVRAARVAPLARVEVQLGYTPPDRRRRDTDNLVATLKAIADGVVDAGVVPDDTPEFMSKPEPVITDPDKARAGLWVRLRDISGDGTTPDAPIPPMRAGQERSTAESGAPARRAGRSARESAPRGLPPATYPYNPRKETP